jgi:uncharacterized protein YhaN
VKILDLEIDGFGVWSRLRLGDLGGAITVFLGPNEAGKTTLMQFIRAVLYGFSDERRRRYLPPVRGGRAGGTVTLAGVNGQVRVSRHSPAATDDGQPDELRIVSADGSLEDERVLAGLLAKVSESTFTNVFAVGLRELQELGSLGDAAAADMLYHVSTGLGHVSISGVLRELADSRERLLSTDDHPCQLDALVAQRDKCRGEIDELRGVSQRYTVLALECERLAAEAAAREAEASELAHSLRVVEAAVAAREPWKARASLDAELARLAELPPAAAGALERIDSATERIDERNRQLIEIKQERAALRREIVALGLNGALARHAPRIEALAEQEPWLVMLENQIRELEADGAAMSNELAAQRERFGLAPQGTATAWPKLDQRSLAGLRRAARTLGEPRTRRRDARRQAEKARLDADRHGAELRAALAGREHNALAPALEQAGNLAAQLRRRVQLDERVSQLGRQQAELNEESHDLLDAQLLPGWVLTVLGGAFVVGVVLLMTRIYLPAFLGAAGWWLSVLGLLGIVAAGGAKYMLEHAAANRLETCRKRTATLAKQLEQAKQEREALDAQLSRGGGPLLTRLQAAEKDLAALEELLAVDAKRQTSEKEAAAAQARHEQAHGALRAARRRWHQALAAAGLPGTLSPRQVRRYAAGSERADELERRLKRGQQELDQRRGERDALAARVRQLIGDVGLKSADQRTVDQLRLLRQALAEHEALAERHELLERRAARFRRRQARLVQGIRRWRQRREQWLRHAGVRGEAELRLRAAEHARREALVTEREQRTREIAAALGWRLVEDRRLVEDDIGVWLDGPDAAELERSWDDLAGRSQAVQRELTDLFQRRGHAQQELATLAGDRRMADRLLDLGTVETRLRDAIESWQTLAVTSRLLDGVRRSYETDRQPETLQEASKHFQRLTGGRYTRVWTPLGEQALYVDGADGQTLSVDVLSRGTREQLFLSLRLGLVASYARRGVVLPFVFDDVLVNFDAQRAKAAVAALRDFAALGHQTLVFTCHEHVWRLFKQLKVPARRLPANAEHETVSVAYEAPAKEKVMIEPAAAEACPPLPSEPSAPAAAWRPKEATDDLIWVDDDEEEDEDDHERGGRTSYGDDIDPEPDDCASGTELPAARTPRERQGEGVHRVIVVRAHRASGPFDDTFWHDPVEDDLDDIDEVAVVEEDEGPDDDAFDERDERAPENDGEADERDIDTEGEELFAGDDAPWEDMPFDDHHVEGDEAA